MLFFDDNNGSNDSIRELSPLTQQFNDLSLQFLIKAKETSQLVNKLFNLYIYKKNDLSLQFLIKAKETSQLVNKLFNLYIYKKNLKI